MQAAPSIPDSAPKRAGDEPHVGAIDGQRAARDHLARRGQQQLAGGDRAPADDDHLGVEDVDQRHDAQAQALAHERHHLAGDGIAVVRQLGDEGARDRRARSRARARARVSGASRARRSPSRPIAWPDTSASRQPWPGQLPGHGGPSASTMMCPSSAAAPCAPCTRRPSTSRPAADAGPERQHDRVARAARLAPAPLREHRRVAVVVDGDGQPEPLGQHVADRDALQRQVVGVQGDAGRQDRPGRGSRARLRAPARAPPRRPPARPPRAGPAARRRRRCAPGDRRGGAPRASSRPSRRAASSLPGRRR